MSDTSINIEEAQKLLDSVVDSLAAYKVPAWELTLEFLEMVLNFNGFQETKIVFDHQNLNKPTVNYVKEEKQT